MDGMASESDGWLTDSDIRETNTASAWLARQQEKLFHKKEGKPWQVGPEQVCVNVAPCFTFLPHSFCL